VYTLFENVLNDPAKYGLTNVTAFPGKKDFLPVEPPPQADLSFLFLLGAPRFA
jgi:phospholipase/lecithinase/hemolysin